MCIRDRGRPDCTDAEKLAVLKEYGATRISINPQTFSNEVLARIGRKHSAADILHCFEEARAAGQDVYKRQGPGRAGGIPILTIRSSDP